MIMEVRRQAQLISWFERAFCDRISTPLLAVLSSLLILLVALRYAQPINDGDLFWHMAYAKQMIEHGTLTLDHTLYSWTPTNNAIIYCAWLGELALYGLWRTAGLAGVFALRYAIVATVGCLIVVFARRQKVAQTPGLFVGLLLALELGSDGVAAKPEMFSYFFFCSIVFVYANFRAAVDPQRAAIRLYIVPAIVLIWVNSHGGFMLASLFLAAVAVGEIALYTLRADACLPFGALKHMVAAWALCAVAVALTPYGIDYPVSLINEYALGSVARPDVRWNTAYRSIFDPAVGYSYQAGLAGITGLVALLCTLAARRCGKLALRWLPLALAAFAYAPLYVAFLRSTQFLPIVAAFLVIALSGMVVQSRGPRLTVRSTSSVLSAGALCVTVLLTAVTAFIWLNPPRQGWHGFGIDDSNPVIEAEFLARQNIGTNLYNVFDSGGYLLWRLYPQYRVMTDSRSFPYLSWFEDQYAFTAGSLFEPFLQKYPADIAVIDLAKQELWRNFSETRNWRLVFYGPTAAIFVREEKFASLNRTAADSDPARFIQLNSEGAAINVFEFATYFGDYNTAGVVLERLQSTLRWRTPAAELSKAEDYRSAIHAIRAEKYADALEMLERGLWSRPVSDRDRFVVTLLVSLVRNSSTLDAAARSKIVDALNRIVPPGM